MLLPDGKLRHFIKNLDDEDDFHQKDNQESTRYYYDHEQGQYCMEKVILFVFRENRVEVLYLTEAEWTHKTIQICSVNRLIY